MTMQAPVRLFFARVALFLCVPALSIVSACSAPRARAPSGSVKSADARQKSAAGSSTTNDDAGGKSDTQRCESGDGAACFAAARAVPPGAEHAENEERLYARGCAAKHVPSCIEDGRVLAWGTGSWANHEKGASLLRSMCEQHVEVACARYGELLRGAAGVPQDYERA